MKNSILKVLIGTIVIAVIWSCTASQVSLKDGQWDYYTQVHMQWKKDRLANLKKPLGYLSMVGLYWLSEGENTFGSASTNDLQFPYKFPDELGTYSLKDNHIYLTTDSTADYTIDNKKAKSTKILSDADGKANMHNWQSYYWHVIKRGDRYGIRLKDTLATERLNRSMIPSYHPKQEWVKKGTFIKAEDDQTIEITNKVGITYDSKLKGTVNFNHNGENYSLVATNGGVGKLFMVFADQTNGMETYGGGRFLYADIPLNGDEIVLDFNKAENPICAFSDYATCPLPRKENFLPFAIRAGEKRVR